jgi:glutathione S-transferase
MTEKISLYYKD